MSRITVIACPRSHLGAAALPAGTRVVEVPCAGRVSLPLLFSHLLSGDDGVLVLGRHPETCRFGGAEEVGAARTEAAGRLAHLAGLGSGRVRFAQPAPGPDGPGAAVAAFAHDVAALGPNPLGHGRALPGVDEGLDATLDLLRAIGARLPAEGSAWTEQHDLPGPAIGAPALVAGAIPYLDLAGGTLFRPLRAADLLQSALSVLAHLGASGAGVVASGLAPDWTRVPGLESAPTVYTLSPGERNTLTSAGIPVRLLDDVLRARGHELPAPLRAAVIACDGSPDQVALIETLGYRAVDVGIDPLPPRFRWTADERARADARLDAAERAGAVALLVNAPLALARWAVLTREGAWRGQRVLPVLGHQLAWHNLSRVPLQPRSLTAPLAAALAQAEELA